MSYNLSFWALHIFTSEASVKGLTLTSKAVQQWNLWMFSSQEYIIWNCMNLVPGMVHKNFLRLNVDWTSWSVRTNLLGGCRDFVILKASPSPPRAEFWSSFLSSWNTCLCFHLFILSSEPNHIYIYFHLIWSPFKITDKQWMLDATNNYFWSHVMKITVAAVARFCYIGALSHRLYEVVVSCALTYT